MKEGKQMQTKNGYTGRDDGQRQQNHIPESQGKGSKKTRVEALELWTYPSAEYKTNTY